MTTLIKTDDYTLHVDITPVARIGHHVKFTTTLATAKDPATPRTAFEFTGSTDTLLLLRLAISLALDNLS